MHVKAHVLGGGVSAQREPFAELVDYETGVLPDAQAAAFEEELFAVAAAGRAEEAAFVDKISLIAQHLVPRGGFDIGSTRARIDQLLAAGLRVQIIDPDPSLSLQLPPIDDDAEIVVTVIRLDGRGYDSIDVVVEKPDGTELKTFRDVSCDPDTGFFYAVCEAPLARISLQQRHIVSHIIGTRNGTKHTLASFATIAAT